MSKIFLITLVFLTPYSIKASDQEHQQPHADELRDKVQHIALGIAKTGIIATQAYALKKFIDFCYNHAPQEPGKINELILSGVCGGCVTIPVCYALYKLGSSTADSFKAAFGNPCKKHPVKTQDEKLSEGKNIKSLCAAGGMGLISLSATGALTTTGIALLRKKNGSQIGNDSLALLLAGLSPSLIYAAYESGKSCYHYTQCFWHKKV